MDIAESWFPLPYFNILYIKSYTTVPYLAEIHAYYINRLIKTFESKCTKDLLVLSTCQSVLSAQDFDLWSYLWVIGRAYDNIHYCYECKVSIKHHATGMEASGHLLLILSGLHQAVNQRKLRKEAIAAGAETRVLGNCEIAEMTFW